MRITFNNDQPFELTSAIVDEITRVLQNQHPRLTVTNAELVPVVDTSDDTMRDYIASLSGRSRIIAKFLFENPGVHSTQEIREIVEQQVPFKNQPILHSYLSNLVSRGLIIKESPGRYRSARVTV